MIDFDDYNIIFELQNLSMMVNPIILIKFNMMVVYLM